MVIPLYVFLFFLGASKMYDIFILYGRQIYLFIDECMEQEIYEFLIAFFLCPVSKYVPLSLVGMLLWYIAIVAYLWKYTNVEHDPVWIHISVSSPYSYYKCQFIDAAGGSHLRYESWRLCNTWEPHQPVIVSQPKRRCSGVSRGISVVYSI